MLYKYGYKRIYKTELYNDINTNLEEAEYLLEEHKKDFIIETLEKLKSIQSKYQLVKNSEQKIARNKKLVATLKDLYQCRCQICNPDVIQIPAIYNEKDELYAEVHHITSIAQAKEFNDDIEFIDSYANTMVLCPYHHKFVHIQNGGYTKLVKDENDILFLENKYGERIQIYINYHLDV